MSFRRIPSARSTVKSVSTPTTTEAQADNTADGLTGTPEASSQASFNGTRRWVDGTLLVSSGHAGLDAILGGGLPLGSMVCIDADSTYTHANAFASLYLAQGVASQHNLVVGHNDPDEYRSLISSLPLNVSRGSQDTAAVATRDSPAQTPTLQIAHAYTKYLTTGGSAPKEDGKFCHSFDLNRHIPPETLSTAMIQESNLGYNCRVPEASILKPERVNRVLYHKAVDGSFWQSAGVPQLHTLIGGYTSAPARILGGAFGLDGCDPELATGQHTDSTQLKLQLLEWRRWLASSPIPTVFVTTMRMSILPPSLAAEIKSLFDVVIKLHSFTDLASDVGLSSRFSGDVSSVAAGTAPEFADCQGVLLLRKLSRPGLIALTRHDTILYTIKRDKRKIILEKPHLPPEDAPKAENAASSCASGQMGATEALF